MTVKSAGHVSIVVAAVGIAVGALVGERAGCAVVGFAVGDLVGGRVGCADGWGVGWPVGRAVGGGVGIDVGSLVGLGVGCGVGKLVGSGVGTGVVGGIASVVVGFVIGLPAAGTGIGLCKVAETGWLVAGADVVGGLVGFWDIGGGASTKDPIGSLVLLENSLSLPREAGDSKALCSGPESRGIEYEP